MLTLAEVVALSGVDVETTVLTSFAGDKVRTAMVFQLAIRANGEPWGRGCTFVALELGGRGCKS